MQSEDDLRDFFEASRHYKEQQRLNAFIAESNAKEGIKRDPTAEERALFKHFMGLKKPNIASLEKFLGFYERAGELGPKQTDDPALKKVRLREAEGQNVVIRKSLGDGRYKIVHQAPPGGPDIRTRLNTLLREAPNLSPNQLYDQFEVLHPFCDGNGRAGRLLWVWRAGEIPGKSFFEAYHDQSLNDQSNPRTGVFIDPGYLEGQTFSG